MKTSQVGGAKRRGGAERPQPFNLQDSTLNIRRSGGNGPRDLLIPGFPDSLSSGCAAGPRKEDQRPKEETTPGALAFSLSASACLAGRKEESPCRT